MNIFEHSKLTFLKALSGISSKAALNFMPMKSSVLGIVLMCLLALSFSKADPVAPGIQLFEKTLELLDTNYYGYSSFDPKNLRNQFQPQLENACKNLDPCPFSASEGVVTDLISSLNDPHTYRLNLEQTKARDREFAGQSLLSTSIGVRLTSLPDADVLLINRVLQGSPADKAGLKRGDRIYKFGDFKTNQFQNETEAINAFKALEAENKTFKIRLASPDAATHTLEVTPTNLPPWNPQLEWRGNIAIITIFQFKAGGQVASKIHALVRQAQKNQARAIVLDVRDSAGGLVTEMLSSVGAFFEHPVLLDEFRWGKLKFEFLNGKFMQTENDSVTTVPLVAQPTLWTGKLAVLTNGIAKSAPEYLAYLLQKNKRAKVYGTPTLGALDTSNSFFNLPDGSSMAISLGRAQNADGTKFPSRVTPDQIVPDDMLALSLGRDVILETALRSLEDVGN
jgi:carboxyl-terminal processing protease